MTTAAERLAAARRQRATYHRRKRGEMVVPLVLTGAARARLVAAGHVAPNADRPTLGKVVSTLLGAALETVPILPEPLSDGGAHRLGLAVDRQLQKNLPREAAPALAKAG